MAARSKPGYTVKDDSPKQEPVSFEIAEALENGESIRSRRAEPEPEDDTFCESA